MVTADSTHFIHCVLQTQQQRQAYRAASKSCSEPFWTEAWQISSGYPSPPMSNPPSPTNTIAQGSLQTTSGDVARALAAASVAPLAPAPTVPANNVTPATAAPSLPSKQPHGPPTPGPSAPTFTTFGAASAIAEASYGPRAIQGQTGEAIGPTSSPFISALTSIAGPSSSRGGRKSKVHVASACVNCKRAHLSCDVQRPCARCIASGKQDTCFDVQHKKRGRPRLRDESEFRVDQPVMDPSSQPSMAAPSAESPPRPMARTRHRRTESFRTLRSQITDPAVPFGGPHPQHASTGAGPSIHPTYSTPYAPPRSQMQPSNFPTAFLDLDLTILRINHAFRDFLQITEDLIGARLGDLITPADKISLQSIRNNLRAERESRDPSYLPPILQPGQDPLEGVTEANIEQLSGGFFTRAYTWSYRRMDGVEQRFPVQVRLARAAVYFIVITVVVTSQGPSQHFVQQTQPSQMAQPAPAGSSYAPAPAESPYLSRVQRTFTQSAPPPSYYDYQNAAPTAVPQQYGGPSLTHSRTHPPPQPPMPYQQQPYPQHVSASPPTPRLSIAEPPTTTVVSDPFTPRSAPISAAHTVVFRSSAAVTAPTTDPSQAGSSENEGSDPRSPRKRRRMQIGDVLQR